MADAEQQAHKKPVTLLAGTFIEKETAQDSDDTFLLDGRRLRKRLYPDLWARIGGAYGADEEYFNIPDFVSATIVPNQKFYHVVVRDLPL